MPTDDEIFEQTFRQMTEDLDLNPEHIAATVVSTLSSAELMDRWNEVKAELMERGELIMPTTDTGKDLQTQYHAYMIEMRKRGMVGG